MDAELCPNKQMMKKSRLFDAHSRGGFGKPFQFHPVMLAHLDYFQPDPVIANVSDFCQPNVDKGLFSFQPQLDFYEVPYNHLVGGSGCTAGL